MTPILKELHRSWMAVCTACSSTQKYWAYATCFLSDFGGRKNRYEKADGVVALGLSASIKQRRDLRRLWICASRNPRSKKKGFRSSLQRRKVHISRPWNFCRFCPRTEVVSAASSRLRCIYIFSRTPHRQGQLIHLSHRTLKGVVEQAMELLLLLGII